MLRRTPAIAWICAAAALAVTVAWSLVIPPFHVPDETAHLGYVQHLAETGELPRDQEASAFSDEQSAAMDAVGFPQVIGQPGSRPPFTNAQDEAGRGLLTGDRKRTGNGDVSVATGQPPLYYTAQVVPYEIAREGTILTRLSLMRLVSCLLAAVTAFFTTLFVRELLPATPWAWAVGGLSVAFQPMFGFISSGVNPDALMFAAAAALFFAVARAFRRGLGLETGLAIGVAACVGALAKLTFLGLVPGALAAVGFLMLRDRRARGRDVMAGAAAAVVPLAVGFGLYALLNLAVWDRPAIGLGEVSTIATQGTDAPNGTLAGELSYTWQLFFPRLPFQYEYFGEWPFYEVWMKGFVGRFGWVDYGFEEWVYKLASYIGVALALLALVGLVRSRRRLLRRLPELVTYALMTGGILLLIGHADFPAFLTNGPNFRQSRYLLPLIPLYAVILGLASRAPGRRWGPALGTLIVLTAFAHTLFSQLLTISRYYG